MGGSVRGFRCAADCEMEAREPVRLLDNQPLAFVIQGGSHQITKPAWASPQTVY